MLFKTDCFFFNLFCELPHSALQWSALGWVAASDPPADSPLRAAALVRAESQQAAKVTEPDSEISSW